MRKNGFWVLLLALLMGMTGCKTAGKPYVLPVSGEQVKEGLLYRFNDDQPWEKVGLLGDELTAAMEAVSDITNWGDYGANGVPAGGVTYILSLLMSDGTEWVCVYCDSGAQKGAFADGEMRILVTGCGLAELWETVSARAELCGADEEPAYVPQL